MRRYISACLIALMTASCADAGDAAHNDESQQTATQQLATATRDAAPTQGAALTQDPAVTQDAVPANAQLAAAGDTVEVWKDANCGCCKDWITHMQKNGFVVVSHDTPNLTPVKQKYGVGADLLSCHTGTVGGYAIEGHVPADLIRRMLNEKPAIAGLAVPGMPIGSPGMEQGSIKQPYDVIAFGRNGERSVYASR